MFAENLKQIRKEKKLSVAKMAEMLEIPARTITSYERDERTPSIDFAEKLYKIFNVNSNWFVSGEGNMFNSPTLKLKKTPDDIRFAVFGNKLNKLQNLNELSIEEMAEILNISEDLYVDLCLSRQKPTINVILSVMKNFDVTFDWFLR